MEMQDAIREEAGAAEQAAADEIQVQEQDTPSHMQCTYKVSLLLCVACKIYHYRRDSYLRMAMRASRRAMLHSNRAGMPSISRFANDSRAQAAAFFLACPARSMLAK